VAAPRKARVPEAFDLVVESLPCAYSCGWRCITRPQIRHLITVSLSSD
jgi:hypothetical protein